MGPMSLQFSSLVILMKLIVIEIPVVILHGVEVHAVDVVDEVHPATELLDIVVAAAATTGG